MSAIAAIPDHPSATRRIFRRLPVGVWIYLFAVLLLVAAAPLLAPYSPTAFQPRASLKPPSATFLFGTDEFGRDVFSRVLWGARPTLVLALASAALGVALGTPTGLLAGYFRGKADEVIMRVMDVLMSFPALILAMFIVVMLGSNQIIVIVAIGVVFWPRSARLVRSVTQDLVRREFVEAAQARGESTFYILRRELLPNIMNIIVVDFSLRIASAVLLTASLSYLGIGVAPPTPAWGLMVRDGQQFLQLAPWLVIFPCLAIGVLSVATVLAGDKLRDFVSRSNVLSSA